MKKIFILMVVLLTTVFAYSTTFPVIEPFNGPTVNNTWEQLWTVDSTLESVQASGEACGDSPLGDGYIGKATCDTSFASTSGNITGEDTDSDYTLQAYIYTEVTNELDPGDTLIDDYWYQMLAFYRVPGNYGRFHTHFNQAAIAVTPPTPRIRLQIANPSFVYTMAWVSPDFTPPSTSSWHKMKIELTGTTALCYFDDAQLPGTADWTAEASSRNAGKFGFGQYMDAAGIRSLYVDMFKAYKGSEPPDPTPTPTPEPPAAAQNWMYFE